MFDPMKKNLRNFTFWLMAFIFAVAVIAVYKTFDNIGSIWSFISRILGILSPFVLGFGLAFLLYGPSNKLEKLFHKRHIPFITKHARGTSILIVYLLLLGIIALILTFAVPALIDGVTEFVNMLIKELPPLYNQLMEWLKEYTQPGGVLQDFDIESKLQEIYNYILSNVTVDKVMSSLGSLISFTSSLLNIFMAVIISVYMLASRESLFRALRAVLSLFIRPRTLNLLSSYSHKIGDIFYGYLYSQALDACLVGVLACIGLSIIGLPNSLLLGMLVGMMNMIPYFGAIIGGCFCVLVALLSGSFWKALAVAAFILIMQQVDGNILQPRIVSHSIGVKPIYVLLAITIGGGLFGFWGIFLGVPAIATVQMLLNDIIAYRNRPKAAVAAAGATGAAAQADVEIDDEAEVFAPPPPVKEKTVEREDDSASSSAFTRLRQQFQSLMDRDEDGANRDAKIHAEPANAESSEDKDKQEDA